LHFRLLGQDRIDSLNPEQQLFARSTDGGMSLLDVINFVKPTILLGVTTVGGLFTEEIIRTMAAGCARPIIFPLSNPTTKSECTAEQAYEWTDGACIFASGSPFTPVTFDDGRTFFPSQCNNMYVFPGIGLGATLCGAQMITDRMLYVAAEALAQYTSDEDVAAGKVFPPLHMIRSCSHRIAVAVIKEAIANGYATKLHDRNESVSDFVSRKMYFPEYVPLVEKREISI
jgi:malate dehydrogenase (oxaloacetate-decarboxylating)(NADP+)